MGFFFYELPHANGGITIASWVSFYHAISQHGFPVEAVNIFFGIFFWFGKKMQIARKQIFVASSLDDLLAVNSSTFLTVSPSFLPSSKFLRGVEELHESRREFSAFAADDNHVNAISWWFTETVHILSLLACQVGSLACSCHPYRPSLALFFFPLLLSTASIAILFLCPFMCYISDNSVSRSLIVLSFFTRIRRYLADKQLYFAV